MGRVRAGLASSALLLLIVVAVSWAIHRFSDAGQMEARFSDVIWETPISSWQEPPVDVSSRVCPLVDDRLRAEIEEGEHWPLTVGNCLFPRFGQERVLAIKFDEAGQCTATVYLAASCSL